MDAQGMKYIAIGLMALAMLGSAIGVGNIFSSMIESIARNPSASNNMQRFVFIGAALAEAMGLFAFLIALILIFVV